MNYLFEAMFECNQKIYWMKYFVEAWLKFPISGLGADKILLIRRSFGVFGDDVKVPLGRMNVYFWFKKMRLRMGLSGGILLLDLYLSYILKIIFNNNFKLEMLAF